jgi:flagellar hook-associated protein 2
VNGLAVTSTTNTLSNIVDGLTLNFSALTTAPVTGQRRHRHRIAQEDAHRLRRRVHRARQADRDRHQVRPDDAQGRHPPGRQRRGRAAAQLRALASATSTASTVFGHLSDVGLELQGDGSMTLNASKVGNALGNLAELKKLFSNTNLVDASQDGFGRRFRVATDAMLGVDGALTTRTDGLGEQLQRNQKAQDALNVRLDGIEKRMRAQYTALDATMATLNSQSSYITQQIAAFNASNASR